MQSLRIGKGIRASYWALPIGLLFLAGGVIQYASLLSFTQTNLLVLLLLSPLLLLRRTWRELSSETPLILLGIHVAVVGLIRGTDPSAIATYIYYATCTVIAAVSARIICSRSVERTDLISVQHNLTRLTKAFLAIQLVVCTLQSIFVYQVVAFAPIPIILEDAVSGTMFLKSDASLSAIAEILIVATFLLPTRGRDRLLITIMGLAVIWLGGSKAAQAVVFIVILAISARHVYVRLGMSRSGIKYLLWLAAGVVLLTLSNTIHEAFVSFVDMTTRAYENRFSWVTADRLAPIGQLFSEDLKILGDGPLTYYNPIIKSWLYDAGFSTFYSLYIDLGIVGLGLYAAYYVRLIWKATESILILFVFGSIVISFSAFNLTLSDLAFAFAINYILRLYQISRLSKADLADSEHTK